MNVMPRPTSADRHAIDLSGGRIAGTMTAGLLEADAVWPTLAPLSSTYPGFDAWYWGKVVPGISTGERRLFLRGAPHAPLAVGIAKQDARENKICTLWVAPAARGCGIAADLLAAMIDWLGDRRPLLTVPAERHREFVPLVRAFGFDETARMLSLYRAGVVEHVFNGSAATFRAS